MNRPPVVDALKTNLFFGQVIGLSEMFTVSDLDLNDTIERYRFTDNGFGFGSFLLAAEGLEPRQFIPEFSPTEIVAADLDRVVYIAPNFQGFETFSIEAFDGEAWSTVSSNFVSTGNSPPRAQAVASVVPVNGRLAFTDMVIASDIESDVAFYRIRDNGNGINSGFFELNGQRLAPNVFHQIRADQLPSFAYVGGSVNGTESFTILASDGELTSGLSTQNVTTGNSRPALFANDVSVTANNRVAASRLINLVDADGDPGVRYVVADLTTATGSGYWELNGRRQVSGEYFNVDGGEFSTLFFVGAEQGRFVDNLSIQVFDGFSFSPLLNFEGVTSGPSVITPTGRNLPINETIAASELFTVSDPDGDAPVFYLFLDQRSNADGGFFTFNGVRQQSDTFFRVNADELGGLVYNAGSTSQQENIFVQVFDGNDFSALTNFSVGSTSPPTISAINGSTRRRDVIDVAPLVTFNDPDNDAAVRYRIRDTERSPLTGQFELDGNRLPQGVSFEVTAEEFARLQYRGGEFGPYTEDIVIEGFDGTSFGPSTTFGMTTLENTSAPIMRAREITARVGTTIDFQTMFTFSDPDGDSLATVGFYDTGSGPNSGFFTIDGVRQAANTFVEVDIDLVTAGRVAYTVASESSREVFRVFGTDGQKKSVLASNISNAVTTPVISATENDISLDTIERRLVTSLVGVGGADAVRFQVFDENNSITSGRLELDGEFLTQGVVNTLTADEFSRLNFVGAVVDTGRQLDPILIRAENSVTGFSEWTRVNLNSDQLGGTPTPNPAQFQKIRGESESAPIQITYHFIDGGGQNGRGTVMNPSIPPLPPYYFFVGDDGLVFSEEAIATLALNRPQRETVREVLANIESFANIKFVETSSIEDSQITYGTYTFQDPGAGPRYVEWYSGFQTELRDGDGNILKLLNENNGIFEERGDIWFDNEGANDEPFDPRSFGDVSLGSFFRKAVFQGTLGSLNVGLGAGLSIFNDFQYNTIFSNRNGGIDDPLGLGGYSEDPSTLQLYDAIAIQGQYGANTGFNTDDNQYRFADAHQRTIWDAGGTDTLNLTTSTSNETIDIRQGQFSSLNGVENSTRIAYETIIENGRGGSGNDNIRGNETVNLLFGNNGDDIITGGGGNDALYGGNGSDIYRWSLGDGRDLIIEQDTLINTTGDPTANSLDIVEFRDPSGALDSLEDDFTFRKFGNDLRIDLTFNQGQGQGTVTLRDFANESSRVERMRMFDRDGLQIAEVDLNSIFTAATNQPQRFQITSTVALDPANPGLGNLSLASPV